jgi:hypothetical protein
MEEQTAFGQKAAANKVNTLFKRQSFLLVAGRKQLRVLLSSEEFSMGI